MLGFVPIGVKMAVGATTAVICAPLALSAAGFGAAGIVGGSTAAVIQAGIGNVAAGGVFAALQSAGVVGLAAGTKAAIGAVGGLVALLI
ncbi:hypothetical protein CHUAL_009881 [Chamberlinius hualienensis]